MPRRQRGDLADLEETIGHAFADRETLAVALTHIGAAAKRSASYQRSEFLGDRVLGLAISAMLFEAFPEADEGELSRRLADLVRKESCAEVAGAWGVARYIHFGPGEKTIPALQQAVLADICESVIGAVFRDGGYAAAASVVRRAFEARMLAPRRPLRDPKTMLQEWAQARGYPVPIYQCTSRSGPDHAPTFLVAVAIENHAVAEATGPSKRIAEQAAAADFMIRENITDPDEPDGH